MKMVTQVCQKCGYKEEVKLYAPEEAERLRLNLVRPCCKKCGSFNVKWD